MRTIIELLLSKIKLIILLNQSKRSNNKITAHINWINDIWSFIQLERALISLMISLNN